MSATASARPALDTPSVDELLDALRCAWARDTSASPESWTPENAPLGQCAVTALVVQDFFGGTLIRAIVRPDVSHYWNRLPDGTELDLTRSQFTSFELAAAPVVRSRDFVLSFPDTVRRYDRLIERTIRALDRMR